VYWQERGINLNKNVKQMTNKQEQTSTNRDKQLQGQVQTMTMTRNSNDSESEYSRLNVGDEHPSEIWHEKINLDQRPEVLAINARAAADAWGVDEPDQLFYKFSVLAIVMAHNVLVDEVRNGNIEEIQNSAGYLIGCARRIERSLGLDKPWKRSGRN
jgi:hypothetical protein